MGKYEKARNIRKLVTMGVTGSEWTKWVRNGPSALDTYLMYLFEARSVRNGYSIFEAQSNTYVALQTNIERDKHTSLSKPINLPISR